MTNVTATKIKTKAPTEPKATTITIPLDLGKVRSKLTSLDGLITAKEWERSAIVFAFTYQSKGGRPAKDAEKPAGTRLSFSEFSDLGIAGLRDRETVARYHHAWAYLIEEGKAADVVPGSTVELPDAEWPPVEKAKTPRVPASIAPAPTQENVPSTPALTLLDRPTGLSAVVLGFEPRDGDDEPSMPVEPNIEGVESTFERVDTALVALRRDFEQIRDGLHLIFEFGDDTQRAEAREIVLGFEAKLRAEVDAS